MVASHKTTANVLPKLPINTFLLFARSCRVNSSTRLPPEQWRDHAPFVRLSVDASRNIIRIRFTSASIIAL